MMPPEETHSDFREDDSRGTRSQRTKSCPMCGAVVPFAARRCKECGDAFYAEDEVPRARPQSRLGIASFVIAVLSSVLVFSLFVGVGAVEAHAPGTFSGNQLMLALIGFGVIGILMLDFAGVVIGIAACFERNRGKLLAAIGVAIGSMILLGTIALIGVGMALQAR